MIEILFTVVEAPEGGLTASAVAYSIVTEADTLDELRQNVREAVECHFEEDAYGDSPQTGSLSAAALGPVNQPFR